MRLEVSSDSFIQAVDALMSQHQPLLLGFIFGSLSLVLVAALLQKAGLPGVKTVTFLGIAGFALGGLVGMVGLGIVKQTAWDEDAPVLKGNARSATVDGKAVSQPGALLAALNDMRTHLPPPDHSPRLPHAFRLLLETSGGRLELALYRNARHPQDYWVNYRKYYATDVDPIGHIMTDALDGF